MRTIRLKNGGNTTLRTYISGHDFQAEPGEIIEVKTDAFGPADLAGSNWVVVEVIEEPPPEEPSLDEAPSGEPSPEESSEEVVILDDSTPITAKDLEILLKPKIIEIAEDLGIDTRGKTKAQLISEILAVVNSRSE